MHPEIGIQQDDVGATATAKPPALVVTEEVRRNARDHRECVMQGHVTCIDEVS